MRDVAAQPRCKGERARVFTPPCNALRLRPAELAALRDKVKYADVSATAATARRMPPRRRRATPGARWRITALLLAVFLTAACAYVWHSPRGTVRLRTPQRSAHATATGSQMAATASPARMSSPSDESALSAAETRQRATARASQFALLNDDIIHASGPFQPHLHLGSYPPLACLCPAPPEDTSDLARLARTAHEVSEPLPTPRRLAVPGLNEPSEAPIFGMFSDVYVVNLPNRGDRQHYMCSILVRLRVPAIFWPAFPKHNSVVRAFASNVKHANFNPLMNYYWLQPPPPLPPPPPPTPPGVTGSGPPLHRKRLPGPHFRAPEVACYLSHREIWLDIVARDLQRPVLLLEDDIDIEEKFEGTMRHVIAQLPADWAVLWVGSCFEETHAHSKKVGHRCFLRPRDVSPSMLYLPQIIHALAQLNSAALLQRSATADAKQCMW